MANNKINNSIQKFNICVDGINGVVYLDRMGIIEQISRLPLTIMRFAARQLAAGHSPEAVIAQAREYTIARNRKNMVFDLTKYQPITIVAVPPTIS